MTWANDPAANFLGCVHTKEPLMAKPESARYCTQEGRAHYSIFLLPTHLYLHIWNCGLRRTQTSEGGVHSQFGRETHKSSKETKLLVIQSLWSRLHSKEILWLLWGCSIDLIGYSSIFTTLGSRIPPLPVTFNCKGGVTRQWIIDFVTFIFAELVQDISR